MLLLDGEGVEGGRGRARQTEHESKFPHESLGGWKRVEEKKRETND